MQFYKNKHISLLLIVTCIVTSSFLAPSLYGARKTAKHKTPNSHATAVDNKHDIIFDLTNVVIKENQIGFAKKIGYGVLASYAVTHWKSPGYRCLDMLAAMSEHESQKPHITIKLKKRTLPRCLVELQEGTKNCAQVKTEIAEGIEHLDTQKFFSSAKEKALMTDIMNLILDPQTVAVMIEPIKQTVQLIQKLKDAGHRVYLVGNTAAELYDIAANLFPEIIQLFDGIIISSHIQKVKPDAAIYNHVIETHNLNPANCIVIEDLEESAATAKSLGMQAIVFDKASNVTKKLKRCGVKI